MSIAARRAAAAKYQPARTDLLLVAEAPPCAADRYFYFEHVTRDDSLFRYVWEGLTGDKPERADKPRHLASLRDRAVFLIDLHEENVSNPTLAQLRPHVGGLVTRCAALAPKRIILIKSSVYKVAFEALRAADLPVINERIPFPSSGQQLRFLESFRRALEA